MSVFRDFEFDIHGDFSQQFVREMMAKMILTLYGSIGRKCEYATNIRYVARGVTTIANTVERGIRVTLTEIPA